MSGKSASLLTKTQRRRLRNDFEDLDESAKRRDQRLIRERIRDGLLDFQLLAEYPDRQLELAVRDLSESELQSALADAYLTVERIRDLHQYDRDRLRQDTQARAETVVEQAVDVESAGRLNLRTTDEIQRQAKEQFTASHWERRAMKLVKLTAGAGIASAVLFFVYAFVHRPLHWDTTGILEELLFVGLTAVAVLFGIVSTIVISVHALRYDIVPTIVVLARWSRSLGRTARRRGTHYWDRIRGVEFTRWSKENTTREEPVGADTSDAHERPLDKLRERYATGELTDEQFERKRKRLLATETREDAADDTTPNE